MSVPERIWYSPGALCRGMDTGLFFNLGNPKDTAHAVKVCGLCPVREECLEAAMREENGTVGFGIRGGLTPKQRRKLAKRRAHERRRNPTATAA